MLTQILTHLADAAIAAPADPSAPAEPTSTVIDTSGVIGTLATVIAPIISAVLGVIIMARASRGRVSESLTSSLIFFLGMFFLGGAGILMAFGDDLANMILQ